MIIQENKNRAPGIRLDWKRYFHSFMEKHGEPIKYAGRLLFPDGWGYSATSYQGPEYPPPEDAGELGLLQLQYWIVMADRLWQEKKSLDNRIRALEQWQQTRSMPLQQRIIYQDRDDKRGTLLRKIGQPEPLDLSGLRRTLEDVSYLYIHAVGERNKFKRIKLSKEY